MSSNKRSVCDFIEIYLKEYSRKIYDFLEVEFHEDIEQMMEELSGGEEQTANINLRFDTKKSVGKNQDQV